MRNRLATVTAMLMAASCVIAPVASAVVRSIPAAAPRVVLAGSTAPAVAAPNVVSAVPASQRLTIQVWLTPDVAGATRFAAAVSTPGSPQFHRYLSPNAYTARFGRSVGSARAVEAWLSSSGLVSVRASAQRDYVTATGTVSAIASAFAVAINRYRVTDAAGQTTTILSNDRDLSVPDSLARDVLAVTGLNSTAPQTFHKVRAAAGAATPSCSQYWAQRTASFSPAFDGLTQGALPVCGYSAGQLRAAYGQTSASTGKGQTIALIEVGAPTAMFDTLTKYAQSNGLPAPTSAQFRQEQIGQAGECGNPADIEEQLDSEAAYAMAPGANQLMVEGDSCNTQLLGVQALFDAQLAVLSGNGNSASASIESNSWGITGGETFPKIYAQTAHAINLRAAAEGVGMYFSSGDSPGVSVPASDPYSLAVGGTTLGIGSAGNRLFETGWSNDDAILQNGAWQDFGSFGDAAGGGASLLYAQPFYQKGVVPASMSEIAGRTDRTLPDISADADLNSGILVGVIEPTDNGQPGPYQTLTVGGTSLAAPLIAGIVANAQQGRPTSFGFINPLIYRLAGSAALHDALPVTASEPQPYRDAFTPPFSGTPAFISVFDSQLPAYTDQVTAPGYDTMTGVGTPNGTAFINALRTTH